MPDPIGGITKESLAPGMAKMGKAHSDKDFGTSRAKRKVLDKSKKVRWPGATALALKKTKGLSEDKPNRYQKHALNPEAGKK